MAAANDNARNITDFLPAALEVVEKPPSPVGRLVTWLIVLLFVIAIIWAWFGRVDTVAVASGKTVSNTRPQIVQNVDTGVVSEILVREGDQVKAGAPLVRLENTSTDAALATKEKQLLNAKVQIAMGVALQRETPLALISWPSGADDGQVTGASRLIEERREENRATLGQIKASVRQYSSALNGVRADQEQYRLTMPSARERLDSISKLGRRGFVAANRVKEQEEELERLEAAAKATDARHDELVNAIAGLNEQRERQRAQFQASAQALINENLEKSRELDEELRVMRLKQKERVVRAPTAGEVQELAVYTVGAVVEPGQALMKISPDDLDLELEALVLNRDIGFIDEGMEVEIKFEAFPFTRYGLIEGRIKNLSRDAIQHPDFGLVFASQIELDSNELLVGDKWVRLSPGMTGQAEVKTGKRRVLSFFLSPFLEYQDEALRER